MAVAGVLPFWNTADLVELGGAAVELGMPVSIWPATQDRTSDQGHHHTHGGQAPLEFADALAQPNRALEYEGDTYRIVGATPMPLMFHVVLDLVRTAGTA